MVFCFRGEGLQKEVILCSLSLWNQPSSRRLPTMKPRRLLQLEFCSRAIYQYFGVPAAVHEALLGAPSKGSYFNQTVRRRFPYRLVTDFNTDAPDVEIPARYRR